MAGSQRHSAEDIVRKLRALAEAEAEPENDGADELPAPSQWPSRPAHNGLPRKPEPKSRRIYGRFREAGTVLGIRLRDHKPLVLAAISHCC